MEEPKPNVSKVTEDRGKENIEPDNIYVAADGTEEVATGEIGKKFKVRNKPSTQAAVFSRTSLHFYRRHTFPGMKRP
jgi:hypothetical protein